MKLLARLAQLAEASASRAECSRFESEGGYHAAIAHLEERQSCKLEVLGSSPSGGSMPRGRDAHTELLSRKVRFDSGSRLHSGERSWVLRPAFGSGDGTFDSCPPSSIHPSTLPITRR